MKVLDALKPTSRSWIPSDKTSREDEYVVNVGGVIKWFKTDGTEIGPAAYCLLIKDIWEPYPEVKEIRPENEEEAWLYEDGGVWVTHRTPNHELVLVSSLSLGSIQPHDYTETIHGKNGWNRINPPVENNMNVVAWGKVMDRTFGEVCKNKDLRRILDAVKPFLKLYKTDKAYGKSLPFIMDEMSARAAGKFPTEGNLFTYAENLATSIWEKHYKDDSPPWKPLDTVYGILSQIDNMVTGMQRKEERSIEFHNVEWDTDGEVVYPRSGYPNWKKLVGKPPMKMILIPSKEDHECQD